MTTILAPCFSEVQSSDCHVDLILMFKALKSGWVPPSALTEDEYRTLKAAEPSAVRGFAGFACSWGGKWFGGYARGNGAKGARNYADESSRSLVRDASNFSNVVFALADYRTLNILPDDVVYCDPPYAETTEYKDAFNSAEFWGIAQKWREIGADVFISEYKAPDGWDCIWKVTRTRDIKSKFTNAESVTECLFSAPVVYDGNRDFADSLLLGYKLSREAAVNGLPLWGAVKDDH